MTVAKKLEEVCVVMDRILVCGLPFALLSEPASWGRQNRVALICSNLFRFLPICSDLFSGIPRFVPICSVLF